jgi:hypothetical protein
VDVGLGSAERPSTWPAAAPRARGSLAALGHLVAQFLLVAGAYLAYRAVRILTEADRGRALGHAETVLDLERSLGLDWELGAQHLALDHRSVVDLCNVLYTWLFWPTVIGALVVLYVADRARYRVYRNALFMSGLVGLVVFAAFPLAPPRMLPGYVDTVVVFSHQESLAHPTTFTNQYAAMPSFHVGWSVLAGLALLPLARRPLMRAALLLPGAVMAVTVVVTANHYVVDGVVGVAVAGGGLWAATVMCRRSRAGHEILDVPTEPAYPARHYARPGVPRGG